MAFSIDSLLSTVLPATVTGLGTAFSTIWAFARDIKKRLDELEKRVGSIEAKSGMAFAVHLFEEKMKEVDGKIKEYEGKFREIDGHLQASGLTFGNRSWPRFNSYPGVLDEQTQKLVTDQLSKLEGRVNDVIEDLERKVEKQLNEIESKFRKLVTEDDFERSDKQRMDEITEVKRTMAEIKGLLQGLQTAFGFNKGR